jgi:hypothetical protein
MGVALRGFSEALAYAWQKEYITEQERSKGNGFAQSLPHSPPLIGNGESGDGWNGFRAGEILIAPSPPGFVKQAPSVPIVTLFSFMISVSIRGYRLH